MRPLYILLFLSMVVCSCVLFPQYRHSNFQYRQDGTNHVITLVVPKGYLSVETKNDSLGNQVELFHYPGGATLYASHLSDTTILIQAIDKSINIPKVLPNGGLIYKGMDSTKLFWREIRRKNFRFGYRSVNSLQEPLFDSATNFMSWQQLY